MQQKGGGFGGNSSLLFVLFVLLSLRVILLLSLRDILLLNLRVNLLLNLNILLLNWGCLDL